MNNFEFTKEIKDFKNEIDNKLKGITFDDLFISELFYQIEDNFSSKEVLKQIDKEKFDKEFTIDRIRGTIPNILGNDTIWEIVNEEINDLFWDCAD